MSVKQSTHFLSELKLDLKANGWINNKLSTAFSCFFFNSGIHLLVLHRIQSRIYKLPIIGKTFSRIISYLIQVLTSCHIKPTAVIHAGVSIPHATGIVIGEGAVIKAGCKIYQQVTLGADSKGAFPVIDENTCIFAGAKIIGGIHIGSDSIVGANSVVLKDFDKNSVIAGVPAKLIKKNIKE